MNNKIKVSCLHWQYKTAIMALAERSLVLAGDGQDEAWMNV